MSINIEFNANQYTSNSFDFNLTRNEVIELAYDQIGIKGINQQLTPEQYNKASKLLNAMVKSWASNNIFLWKMDWFTLPLHNSDIRNIAGVDYECTRNHKSSLNNQPGVGAAWQSFWKSLETTTGVVWAVDNDYVASGNYNIPNEIIGIDVARIKRQSGHTLLHPLSMSDYFSLGTPLIEGQTVRYYFRRLPRPEIFLYPVPDDITETVIEFFAYRYPQDFDNGSNQPDFLQEWIEPLYLGLAVRLASSNGYTGEKFSSLKELAEEAKENARASDHEFGGFFIKPDLRGQGGTQRG